MSAGAPALAGTGTLLRFALRRERVRLVLWVAVAAGLVAGQATASQALYDSAEDLVVYRASVGSNAATIAFGGPPVGLDTVAGTVAFEVSTFLLLAAALMAMSTTGRLSRADEEAGRTELVRAARVGRHAPLLAAVLTSALACVALAAAAGAAAAATGLPATGSFVLGASAGALGLVSTGVTAVAAQVTASARATYGLVGAVFGLAFVLRAVGDVEGSRLVWASPLGWAQASHPWSGDRWPPLLLCVAAAVALLALAVVALDRRDLGAGLVAPRPGPASASRGLLSPLGLALRLQRGALLGWTAGLVLLGAVYGALAASVETLFAGNPEARAFLPEATSLVDGYFATTLATTALLVAGYAVSSVLRARAEEAAGRAEPVLATATGRTAWLGSHVAVALLGSAVLLLASGAATGTVRAAAGGDTADVGRLLVASLAYVPAVWAVAALAVTSSGLLPRAAAAVAWAAVSYVVAATLFAAAMDWPAWTDDLSPIGWTPAVPAEQWTVLPVAVLTAVAAGLVAIGLVAFRRRDVANG